MPRLPDTGYRTLAIAVTAISVLLSGCTFLSPSPTVTATTKVDRIPTQADLTGMEQRIKALDHVTGAQLTYHKGNFGGASSKYLGEVTSDATDQVTLNSILDNTYKIIWLTPGVTPALTNPVVKNPATGQAASFYSLGLDGPPGAPEFEQRYGPRP